jgi:hypothetical protein
VADGTPKTRADLKAHVRKRALERFGWTLTADEIQAVVRDIQRGRARLVDRQSNQVTRWIVHVRGVAIGTAYDSTRKMIRTVMPAEYLLGKDGDPPF